MAKVNKLTPKQERFCLAYSANGGNATQAYKDVYNSDSDEGARAGAYENLTKPHIKARIAELDEETNTPFVLSIEQRKELLTKMALDEEASYRDRQNAVDLLNKMGQVYIQRQEISTARPIVLIDNVKR